MESFGIAQASAYTIGTPPGCDRDRAPVALPPDYDARAREVAAAQLRKVGVRLAAVLNGALGK